MLKLLLAAAVLAGPAAALDYTLDKDHASVEFRIRHLGNKVPGKFKAFDGTFGYEPGKPESWRAQAEIDVASIDTGNDKRDAHLKSPDFFDAAKCPKLTFKSSKVSDVKENTFKLHGDLTMHCVTKPVVLDVEVGGVTKDPWGNPHAGFSAKTTVDRKEFGIVWNKTLDNGGLFLGDAVDVMIEADGTAQPAK